MSREKSAGCLIYRLAGGEVQFLLVHPKGASFRKPLFSIPKGLLEEGERPEDAALRETLEETGLTVRIIAGLGSCQYRTGKQVQAFLCERISGEVDEGGSTPHDWEVDVSKFYPLDVCRRIIHPDQAVFLERASTFLSAPKDEGATGDGKEAGRCDAGS